MVFRGRICVSKDAFKVITPHTHTHTRTHARTTHARTHTHTRTSENLMWNKTLRMELLSSGRLGETYVFSNVCVIIAAAKQMSLQGQKQFHCTKVGFAGFHTLIIVI